MSHEKRFVMRELLYVACFGKDAELQRHARDRLERNMQAAGLDMRREFEAMGFDARVYDDTRPAARAEG